MHLFSEIFSIIFNKIKKPKDRKGFVKISLATFFALFFIVLVAASFFNFQVLSEYNQYFLSPKQMLAYKNNALTFLDRNGQVIYRTPGRYSDKITPLQDMPQSLINATLAAEDSDFYKHSGISLKSTARALFNDLRQKDAYYQGGSTITQQLARTFFLSSDKSFIRKLKEVSLAMQLERKYTKNQILELYLNSIYYGSGAYGVQDAAKVYFNKDVKDLNLSESALLAALPVAPTYLSPISGDKNKAIIRQQYILNLMEEKGLANKTDVELALNSPPKIESTADTYEHAPHFIALLKNQLQEKFPKIDLDTSGLTVFTTLDLNAQKRAEKLLSDKVTDLKYRNVNNAALISTNPKTGEIIAFVGSADYNNKDWGKVDILTSNRSPGSSIKPLVYAAALADKSITTATVLHDQDTVYKNQWETYEPHDSDGKTRGDVLPRTALANSLNIPSVEVLSKVGLPQAVSTVSKLGIENLKNPTSYGLSFVLGGEEVRPIDLAASYGVFASGGNLIKPWGLLKVEDRFGKTLFQNSVPVKNQVLDPKIAYIITNILSDNQARELLFGPGNSLALSRPAAAKTGTSEDFRNVWTVGYTPSLLSLVWFGNNDNSPMSDIWGLESAAPSWNSFMTQTLAQTPVENFTPPNGIEFASICTLDGSKAATGEPSSNEVFVSGTAPNNDGMCSFIAQKQKDDLIAQQQAAQQAAESAAQQAALAAQQQTEADQQGGMGGQINPPDNGPPNGPPGQDKKNPPGQGDQTLPPQPNNNFPF